MKIDRIYVYARIEELTGQIKHYARLQVNATKSTHSEGPFWIQEWGRLADNARQNRRVYWDILAASNEGPDPAPAPFDANDDQSPMGII